MDPHSEQGQEWAHALLHPPHVEPARRRLELARARLASCITTLFEGPDEGSWGDGVGKEACSGNQWAARRALESLRQTWRLLGRRENEHLRPSLLDAYIKCQECGTQILPGDWMEASNPARPIHLECSEPIHWQDSPAWDYVDSGTRAAILELPALPIDAPEGPPYMRAQTVAPQHTHLDVPDELPQTWDAALCRLQHDQTTRRSWGISPPPAVLEEMRAQAAVGTDISLPDLPKIAHNLDFCMWVSAGHSEYWRPFGNPARATYHLRCHASNPPRFTPWWGQLAIPPADNGENRTPSGRGEDTPPPGAPVTITTPEPATARPAKEEGPPRVFLD